MADGQFTVTEPWAKELGITGTLGFIAGMELQPGALDLNGLKDLVTRARNGK